MTKGELKEALAKKLGVTKELANRFIDSFNEIVIEELSKGNEVRTGEFTFTVVQRKGRKGRNPRTWEPVTIPPKKAVKVKPSKKVKEIINK